MFLKKTTITNNELLTSKFKFSLIANREPKGFNGSTNLLSKNYKEKEKYKDVIL